MAELTYFQKRRAQRLDPNMSKLLQRYQGAQQEYTATQASSLRDYEDKLKSYNEQMTSFEGRAKAFQDKADAYNSQVEKYMTRQAVSLPQNWKVELDAGGTNDYMFVRDTKTRQIVPGNQLTQYLQGIGVEWAGNNPQFGTFKITDDSAFVENNVLYKRGGKDPGEFTEKFEETAPAAPEMQDTAEAKKKLESEKTYFERETEERKLGRVRARRRVADRPLLSGTT